MYQQVSEVISSRTFICGFWFVVIVFLLPFHIVILVFLIDPHFKRKESAREDPTFDKYHNMKGKKEDDDDESKSANESMQSNQSADLLIHVELERLSKRSRFQLNPVKGSGMFDGVYQPTNIHMIRPFSEQKSLVVFVIFMYKLLFQ